MNIKKLVYTGLLVAVGVLLPQVFHIFGSSAAGMVFLPMHIPVLIGGLLLGPMSGLCIGVAAPLISFGITGDVYKRQALVHSRLLMLNWPTA